MPRKHFSPVFRTRFHVSDRFLRSFFEVSSPSWLWRFPADSSALQSPDRAVSGQKPAAKVPVLRYSAAAVCQPRYSQNPIVPLRLFLRCSFLFSAFSRNIPPFPNTPCGAFPAGMISIIRCVRHAIKYAFCLRLRKMFKLCHAIPIPLSCSQRHHELHLPHETQVPFHLFFCLISSNNTACASYRIRLDPL